MVDVTKTNAERLVERPLLLKKTIILQIGVLQIEFMCPCIEKATKTTFPATIGAERASWWIAASRCTRRCKAGLIQMRPTEIFFIRWTHLFASFLEQRVRLIKNRLSAKRSRDTARNYVQELESRIMQMNAKANFYSRYFSSTLSFSAPRSAWI